MVPVITSPVSPCWSPPINFQHHGADGPASHCLAFHFSRIVCAIVTHCYSLFPLIAYR